MPAAVAARADDDVLDADVRRIFGLEFDPIAVLLDIIDEGPGDETRRREASPHRSESDGSERRDHRNSGERRAPLLLRTE